METAIWDTGAAYSCLSESWVEKNSPSLQIHSSLPLSKTHVVSAIGGRSALIKEQILVTLKISEAEYLINCLVVKNLAKPIIIGMQTLVQMGCLIDLQNGLIRIQHHEKQFSFPFRKPEVPTTTSGTLVLALIELKQLNLGQVYEKLFTEEESGRLSNLVNRYEHVFSSVPGRIKDFEYTLRVSPSIAEYKPRYYPVPLHLRDAVRSEIRRMIEIGILEQRRSPFINPLRIVSKSDGSLRLCLDARNLNIHLLNEPEAPPSLDSVLAMFQGASIFSSFDLTNSFWQCSLSENSRQYTAFLFDNKTYTFVVVPFGLKCSTSALLRGLSQYFTEETTTFVIRFVDEVLILSRTIDEHFKHIECVLEIFSNSGITVKLTKAQWFQHEIKFLGVILSESGIRADPDRLQAIRDYQRPKNLKSLRGLLGFFGFYRRFQPNFSRLSYPLVQLLKKGVKWKWTSVEEDAFQALKQSFMTHVSVCFPIKGYIYYLSTDATTRCVAAHLYQFDPQDEIHPLAFVSRLLKEHEMSYSISELELLAMHFGITKLRHFLQGTHFIVKTDHQALVFLRTAVLTSPRLARLTLALQEFSYDVEYVPGWKNYLADALSRYTQSSQVGSSFNEILICVIDLHEPATSTFENFGTFQRQDPRLRRIIMKINDRGQTLPTYRIADGLLYHKVRERWKIEIPTALVNWLICHVHEEFLHCGVKKTIGVLKELFTYKALRQRTRLFIQGCQVCQQIKHRPTLQWPMLSIPADQKGDLLSVDFFGPLPPTPQGYKFIFVVLDVATKFIRLYPLQSASGRAALDCLFNDYFVNYNVVKAILADNGTQFTSELWLSRLRRAKIKNLHVAIRHPSANPVERYMNTLGQFMRAAMYQNQNHNEWHLALEKIEICFNELPHYSTHRIPAELFFGKPVTRVWDGFLRPTFVPHPTAPAVLLDDVASAVRQTKLSSDLRAARHQRQKQRMFRSFGIGDVVWAKALNVSNTSQGVYYKFLAKFEGPYVITHDFQNGSYRLDHPAGPSRGVYHITHLKKYYAPIIE